MCSENVLARVPAGASSRHSPPAWTHHSRLPSVRNKRLSSDNCQGKGYIPGPSSHPFHVPVKHLVSQALVVRALEGRVLWAIDGVDHCWPDRVACTAWAGGGERRGSRTIMLLPGLRLSSKAGATWSISEWAEPFIHRPTQDMPAGDPTPYLCRDMRCLLIGQAAWPGQHIAALSSLLTLCNLRSHQRNPALE